MNQYNNKISILRILFIRLFVGVKPVVENKRNKVDQIDERKFELELMENGEPKFLSPTDCLKIS